MVSWRQPSGQLAYLGRMAKLAFQRMALAFGAFPGFLFARQFVLHHSSFQTFTNQG